MGPLEYLQIALWAMSAACIVGAVLLVEKSTRDVDDFWRQFDNHGEEVDG